MSHGAKVTPCQLDVIGILLLLGHVPVIVKDAELGRRPVPIFPWLNSWLEMKSLLRRFVTDERGLEAVEYAIILGLIVAATIAIMMSIGNWVATTFQSVQSGGIGA